MRRTIPFVLMFLLMLMTGGDSWLRVAEAHPQRREVPPPDPTLAAMRKRAEKERNEQRQSQLKHDTDELYKLASELKKSVDSSNENVLSVEVIRKAEQIEKLAKSVRTKMKADGYGSTVPSE